VAASRDDAIVDFISVNVDCTATDMLPKEPVLTPILFLVQKVILVPSSLRSRRRVRVSDDLHDSIKPWF